MLGSVTFQKTCQSLAPSVRAASSSDMSMASRIGISSRTTNGRVTNRVASAIPDKAMPTRFLQRRSWVDVMHEPEDCPLESLQGTNTINASLQPDVGKAPPPRVSEPKSRAADQPVDAARSDAR